MVRQLLICAGWLAVAAGVAGMFIPLLPTVPFLLLAAACFARSSREFHTWLVEHNHLGPLIKDYLEGNGMPLRAKYTAIAMILLSFSVSLLLFRPPGWLATLMVAIGAAIIAYLLKLPTRAPGSGVQT